MSPIQIWIGPQKNIYKTEASWPLLSGCLFARAEWATSEGIIADICDTGWNHDVR